MQNIFSVTTLNNQIKALLETHYLQVSVEGEVSRPTYHSSGHLYFTLKDDKSAISCVMFKGNNQRLKFRVEEGLKVIVSGGISVYTPRGSYQINCASMEPSGSGALALAYEQLKKKLLGKGYFDESRKKALPAFPKHLILITSKTGAAIEDMKRVAGKRWPLIKITLINTLVQGESAAASIAHHIKIADTLRADIIVISRGGGSVEDLWAFNEEIVADAIFHAATPIVSAVGHEIDTVISDYCADLSAPTPSAAMELILPDKTEMLLTLDTIQSQYRSFLGRVLHQKNDLLRHYMQMLKQHSIERKLFFHLEEIKSLKERYRTYLSFSMEKKTQEIERNRTFLTEKYSTLLSHKKALLETIQQTYLGQDPSKKEKIGWAAIVKDGKKVDLEKLETGDEIELQNTKHILGAKIVSKRPI